MCSFFSFFPLLVSDSLACCSWNSVFSDSSFWTSSSLGLNPPVSSFPASYLILWFSLWPISKTLPILFQLYSRPGSLWSPKIIPFPASRSAVSLQNPKMSSLYLIRGSIRILNKLLNWHSHEQSNRVFPYADQGPNTSSLPDRFSPLFARMAGRDNFAYGHLRGDILRQAARQDNVTSEDHCNQFEQLGKHHFSHFCFTFTSI